MKKIVFAVIVCVYMLFTLNVSAEDNAMKISLDGEVKLAKDIGNGKGITFELPNISNTDFYIYAVELAVFEKQKDDTEWHIYTDKDGNETKRQYIENPDSLVFNVDFGDLDIYRPQAKYKIAYRYYMQCVHDMSKVIIAGADVKDGWRLIGEPDSIQATSTGFMFYKNSAPEYSVKSFSYNYFTPDGEVTKTLTPDSLSTVKLPQNAFAKGVTVNGTASDFDTEDELEISYILKDGRTDEEIEKGIMDNSGTIKTEYKCSKYTLQIVVSDGFGGTYTTETYEFILDTEPACITQHFDDGGYALRGRNLFSDFYINDNSYEPMTDGVVIATIYKYDEYVKKTELKNMDNGVYRLDIADMSDGRYRVELELYDKAGNRSTDTFYQVLDDTEPGLRLVLKDEDASSTIYKNWTNETKYVIIEAMDEHSSISRDELYCDGILKDAHTRTDTIDKLRQKYSVSDQYTGKTEYSCIVYDSAKQIDKSTNKYIPSVYGNKSTISNEVWLDKTAPTITVSHNDDGWKTTPYTVSAEFYDYPSSIGKDDVSGVEKMLYAITPESQTPETWQIYKEPIVFLNGDISYIHFKAVDFAGNSTIITRKIKINTKSEMVGIVRPTNEYKHTIYNSRPGFYVVKNTAYNTKYHFEIEDKDLSDILHCKIRFVSRDNSDVVYKTEVESTPTDSQQRDIEFNISYVDGTSIALPDGVYDMFLTITEIKSDGNSVITYVNEPVCEVVIKRNAPPTPIITTDAGKVTIEYPVETLSGSLNIDTVRSQYKKQYKTVEDGAVETNLYKTYTSPFDAGDFIVTALYTDIAGNCSVASKRIHAEGGTGTDDYEILKDGNTTAVEEARSADVYYIGTRREKNKGIDNAVFEFIR